MSTTLANGPGAPSPRVPGLEPTFRHLDDADQKWQEVRSIQRAKVLPDPPIEFPAWLQDLRQRWVVEGTTDAKS